MYCRTLNVRNNIFVSPVHDTAYCCALNIHDNSFFGCLLLGSFGKIVQPVKNVFLCSFSQQVKNFIYLFFVLSV
jgi:hypothetical protein